MSACDLVEKRRAAGDDVVIRGVRWGLGRGDCPYSTYQGKVHKRHIELTYFKDQRDGCEQTGLCQTTCRNEI